MKMQKTMLQMDIFPYEAKVPPSCNFDGFKKI